MEVMRDLTLLSIMGRVGLSVLIGGIIGMERFVKNQPVGARTYMLVCMGACLVMMTNQYIYNLFDSGDPSRLGAQVISGIGFLGAGTIIVTGNNKIRGLTTAAGLWSAACIGLAIGIGFYEGAIAVGVMLFLIMTVFKRVERMIRKNSKALRLYLSVESNVALNNFITECHKREIRVDDMQVSKQGKFTGKDDGIIVFLTVKLHERQQHSELIHQLGVLDGVLYIEEL